MSERTTVNVTKESHSAAGEVKDRHDETWNDVLEFYANHRGGVSNDGLGVEQQVSNGGLDPQEFEAKMQERHREIKNRIDDLESTLPAKTAREVREQR